jgi:hypothetical protein
VEQLELELVKLERDYRLGFVKLELVQLEFLGLELDLMEQHRLRSFRSLGVIARSAPALTPALSRDGSGSLDERAASLIVGLTAVLCGSLTLAAPQLVGAFSKQPERSVTVLALTLVLQMFAV